MDTLAAQFPTITFTHHWYDHLSPGEGGHGTTTLTGTEIIEAEPSDREYFRVQHHFIEAG